MNETPPKVTVPDQLNTGAQQNQVEHGAPTDETIEAVRALTGEAGAINISELAQRARSLGGVAISRSVQVGEKVLATGREYSLKGYDTAAIGYHGVAKGLSRIRRDRAYRSASKLDRRIDFFDNLSGITSDHVPGGINTSVLHKPKNVKPLDATPRTPLDRKEKRANKRVTKKARSASMKVTRASMYENTFGFKPDKPNILNVGGPTKKQQKRMVRKAVRQGRLTHAEAVDQRLGIAAQPTSHNKTRKDRRVSTLHKRSHKIARKEQKSLERSSSRMQMANKVREVRFDRTERRIDRKHRKITEHREKRDLARARRATR